VAYLPEQHTKGKHVHRLAQVLLLDQLQRHVGDCSEGGGRRVREMKGWGAVTVLHKGLSSSSMLQAADEGLGKQGKPSFVCAEPVAQPHLCQRCWS
jgi:hypothetical protein